MKINNDILKKQRAFTIVEMLITIIIIGIVAGILILSAYAFIEKAKETECSGERRQITAAYTIEKYTSGKDFETTIVKVMSETPNAEEISIASNEATYSGLCKDDGVYTVTPYHDMSVKVVCSVHGGGEETTSGDTG
ncbi:MAG: prepilin-type N-terminal cleavage/methylation domain-containing protein, partial [Synergistaceae bacterium]|nr:prepilin-type N-terminal cleavage/methylation domain-containing protein [Synergistaceae bacterium]